MNEVIYKKENISLKKTGLKTQLSDTKAMLQKKKMSAFFLK
jgi:hypothetical protein